MKKKTSPAARLSQVALLIALLAVPRLINLDSKPLMHDESMFAWYAFQHYKKLEKEQERKNRIRNNELLEKGLENIRAEANAAQSPLRDRKEAVIRVEDLKHEFPNAAKFYEVTINELEDPNQPGETRLTVYINTISTLKSWIEPFVPVGYTHQPILHGPLMILGMGYTYCLLGDSTESARTFIAVCSIVAMAACLGLWPSRYRWWFASILFTSPILLYYSRFIRNEMVFCMVMMIGMLGMSRALTRGRTSPLWAIMGMAGMLAMLAVKENALFVYASGITFGIVCLGIRLFWKKPVLPWRPIRSENKHSKPSVSKSLKGLPTDTPYVHPSFGKITGESGPAPPDVQPEPEPVKSRTSVEQGKSLARITLKLGGYALGIFAGILILAMIYGSTAPQFKDGWLDNMKGSWDYWLGQHKEHRIEGPLHYHMPILLTYELPVLLLLYAGLLFDAMLRPARLRFYGYSLLAGFVLWMAWIGIIGHPTPAWLIYPVLILILHLLIISLLRICNKSIRPGTWVTISLLIWGLLPFYILYTNDGMPRSLAKLGNSINNFTTWPTVTTFTALLTGGCLVTLFTSKQFRQGTKRTVTMMTSWSFILLLLALMIPDKPPPLLAKISGFLHIEPSGSMLALGLMFTPLLNWSIIALKEHRLLAAWTGWWAACSLFQYSSAGEKVPWLAVHMILPIYMAVGWIWSPLLRRFTFRGQLTIFVSIILINLIAWRANLSLVLDRAADPRERLVYNHTPTVFDRTCKKTLEDWEKTYRSPFTENLTGWNIHSGTPEYVPNGNGRMRLNNAGAYNVLPTLAKKKYELEVIMIDASGGGSSLKIHAGTSASDSSLLTDTLTVKHSGESTTYKGSFTATGKKTFLTLINEDSSDLDIDHVQVILPLSSRKVVLVEETGWPGYWYFRHCKPIQQKGNLTRVSPGTDLIISRQVFVDPILDKYQFKNRKLLDMRRHWFAYPPGGRFTKRLNALTDYWWNRNVWHATGSFPIVIIEPVN